MPDPTDETEDLEGNVEWYRGKLHRAMYSEGTTYLLCVLHVCAVCFSVLLAHVRRGA